MRIGDKVIMNGKCEVPSGEENRIWTVDSPPWATAHAKVVKLRELGGYYPLHGLSTVLNGEGK